MAKQKINTPGLYPKDDFVKVVPTTKPMGIYFALRHLYTDDKDVNDKDVNDWYTTMKYAKKRSKECEWGWETVPSYTDLNPWQTTNFRNGVK